MKITIDTREDSKEEIKKIIQLLSALVRGEKGEIKTNTDLFSGDTSAKENSSVGKENSGFMNMFGGEIRENKEMNKEMTKSPEGGTPVDFSGFMGLINNNSEKGLENKRGNKEENKEKNKEETPKVVSY